MSSSSVIYGVSFSFDSVYMSRLEAYEEWSDSDALYQWDLSEVVNDELSCFISSYEYDGAKVEGGNTCIIGMSASSVYTSWDPDFNTLTLDAMLNAKSQWDAFVAQHPGYIEKLLKTAPWTATSVSSISEPCCWITHAESSQSEGFLIYGLRGEMFKDDDDQWQVELSEDEHQYDLDALNAVLREQEYDDSFLYDKLNTILKKHLGNTSCLLPFRDAEEATSFPIIVGQKVAGLLEGHDSTELKLTTPKLKGKHTNITKPAFHHIVEFYGC